MASGDFSRRHLYADDGDIRGYIYSKQFLVGNSAISVNQTNADSIIGTAAYDIMRAANYDRKDQARDNDVHWEFTDFVIKTALFHRKIDAPTGAGNRLELVRPEVERKADAIMNRIGAPAPAATEAEKALAELDSLRDAIAALFPDISGDLSSSLLQALKATLADLVGRPDATPESVKQAVVNALTATIKSAVTSKYNAVHTTLASNPEAKALYDNVYAKFNSLSIDDQQFFKSFAELQSIGSDGLWHAVDKYDISGDLSRYRINLKKELGCLLYTSPSPRD